MPTMTPFKYELGSGEKFSLKRSVSSDGTFSIKLGNEMFDAAVLVKDSKDYDEGVWIGTGYSISGTDGDKVPTGLKIEGNKLLSVEKAACLIIEMHMKINETFKKVILLRTGSNTRYYLNKLTGGIGPTSESIGLSHHDENCKWYNTIDTRGCEGVYGIDISAVVAVQLTKTYGAENNLKELHDVNYRDRVKWTDNDTLLNKFEHRKFSGGYNFEDYEMLEYDEDTVEFFINTMTNLCVLAERLKTFFADKEQLKFAIKNKQKLLT